MQPLLGLMKDIGQANGGKTCAQVIQLGRPHSTPASAAAWPAMQLLFAIGWPVPCRQQGCKGPAQVLHTLISSCLLQVAINWCICKGTLPIPGAKNAQQAAELAGAMGWRMSDDQVAALDKESDKVSASAQGAPFEQW